MSDETTTQEARRATDVLRDDCGGRITYRIFDHWCRTGYLRLSLRRPEGSGPGHERRLTEREARALVRMVDEHEELAQRGADLASGATWERFLADD